MRHRILLLVVVAAVFGSCTTMYKSGQTPDDVYYSPAREVPGYVETNTKPDNTARQNEDMSDAYLRMKTYDRNRWSSFDNDYLYWNDWRWNNQVYYNSYRPYSGWNVGYGTGYYNSGWSMGLNYGWGSPYYGYGNYSPFYPGYYGTPVVVVNPKTYAPRTSNLRSYGSNITRNISTDPKTGARTYNISSPSSAPTRTFRRGTTGMRSSESGYYYDNNSSSKPRFQSGSSSTPSRSLDRNNSNSGSTNSSGTRSSSGSSGSGSAPVRSFPRGGGR